MRIHPLWVKLEAYTHLSSVFTSPQISGMFHCQGIFCLGLLLGHPALKQRFPEQDMLFTEIKLAKDTIHWLA